MGFLHVTYRPMKNKTEYVIVNETDIIKELLTYARAKESTMISSNVITVLDCAIKTPSDPCIERLRNSFTQVEWKKIDATKICRDGLNQVKESDFFIIFGSHSNVEDRLPWQLNLASFMKERILEGRPTLGICFGHQLMADAFGGSVIKRSEGYASGPREVKFNSSFGHIQKDESRTLGVSHSYEVEVIPDCFEVLASSPECKADALKHRKLPYYSFQAHPEGSESFFESECPSMKGKELELVMSQGLTIIGAFLQSALKVSA